MFIPGEPGTLRQQEAETIQAKGTAGRGRSTAMPTVPSSRRRWVATPPIGLESMTWEEISGSGAAIGSTPSEKSARCGARHSSKAFPAVCSRPTAPPVCPAGATSTSVSVVWWWWARPRPEVTAPLPVGLRLRRHLRHGLLDWKRNGGLLTDIVRHSTAAVAT
jgi:hypothetical protein